MVPRSLAMTGVAGLVAAAAAVALAFGETGTPPPRAAAPKLHRDAAGLERATASMTVAYTRRDPAGLDKALADLESACRALTPEEGAAFPRDVYVQDMAFHKVVETAKGWVEKKDFDRFIEAAVWIYRSCGRCHDVAARSGLVETAPLPAYPGAP